MTIGTCPACGSEVAPRAEICPTCGEPLTSLARVLTSSTARPQPRWLDQNRQRAGDLRKTENTAADERMASLVAVDRRRMEAERAMAVQTASRERRAMLLAGAVLALVVVLAAAVLLTFVF